MIAKYNQSFDWLNNFKYNPRSCLKTFAEFIAVIQAVELTFGCLIFVENILAVRIGFHQLGFQLYKTVRFVVCSFKFRKWCRR